MIPLTEREVGEKTRSAGDIAQVAAEAAAGEAAAGEAAEGLGELDVVMHFCSASSKPTRIGTAPFE